jgi:hypothetical protein
VTTLCVRRPHPPRLDACTVIGLWAECGGGLGECRYLHYNSFTGPLPTELGNLDALETLCVRRPHPPRLDACAVTGVWAERGGGLGCRMLHANSFTGPLPTELGTMDALAYLYVHRPHPRRRGLGEFNRQVEGQWKAGRVQRARRGGQQRTCTRCARNAAKGAFPAA